MTYSIILVLGILHNDLVIYTYLLQNEYNMSIPPYTQIFFLVMRTCKNYF